MKILFKLFGSLGLALLILTISSCDKKVAKIVLNDVEAAFEAYGDDDDFFEPVAGIYPVIEEKDKLQTTIDFVKTEKTSISNYSIEEFVLYPNDNNEDRIKVNGSIVEFHAENKNSIAQDLLKANVGDKVRVTFTFIPADKTSKKDLIEKIYSCDMEFAGSSSSKDWDKVLDEYESYVNQYISFFKKAKKGDMSAMGEYAKLLEKAERLSEKIEDAEDEMSSSQLARYTKITSKMTQSLIDDIEEIDFDDDED